MSGQFSIFSTLLYTPELRKLCKNGRTQASWNHENQSCVYLLDYHRDRLLRAATHWNWPEAIVTLSGPEAITRLAEGLDRTAASTPDLVIDYHTQDGSGSDTALRMRIVVNRDGIITYNKAVCPSVPVQRLFPTALPAPNTDSQPGEAHRDPPFEVVLDTQKTDKSAYTHFKTTRRHMYDEARARAAISLRDAKEVLTVNHEGYIIEGSITTVYLWRGGRWVTPRVSKAYDTVGQDGDGGNDGVTRRWALENGLVVEDSVLASSLEDKEEVWLSNGARGFFVGRVSLT